jgi:hypothetical protein
MQSTTFVLVYLMRAERMGFKQAFDYVRSKRTIVCPNDGFQRELKKYELTLKKMQTMEKEKPFESMTQSEQIQEKKVVLEFLKEEKPESSKVGPKMNATVGSGYGRSHYGSSVVREPARGLMRGVSLNYGRKNGGHLMEGGLSRNRGQDFQKAERDTNKLTQQFLTFKLEQPKIVTIKK